MLYITSLCIPLWSLVYLMFMVSFQMFSYQASWAGKSYSEFEAP